MPILAVAESRWKLNKEICKKLLTPAAFENHCIWALPAVGNSFVTALDAFNPLEDCFWRFLNMFQVLNIKQVLFKWHLCYTFFLLLSLFRI
jgi:hypothetical protein